MKESTFEKYKLVVDEWFINGFNGTKAYQKYYPKVSDEAADASFRNILGKTRVKEYKHKKHEEIKQAAKMTLEKAVQQISEIATFDIAECYNENGSLKSIHDIPKHIRTSISGIKVTEEFEGFGKDRESTGFTKELKIINKLDAYEKLMKHLGGYEKHQEGKKVSERVIINMSDHKK